MTFFMVLFMGDILHFFSIFLSWNLANAISTHNLSHFPITETKNHQKSFGKLFGNLPILPPNPIFIFHKNNPHSPKIHPSTPSTLPQINSFLRIQSFPYYNAFIFTLIFIKI